MAITDSMIIYTLENFISEMKEHLDHCQHWEHAIIDKYEKKQESLNIDVTCKSNNITLNNCEDYINELLLKCKEYKSKKEENEKEYKSIRDSINSRINRIKVIIEDAEDNIKYINDLHHEYEKFIF